MSTGLAPEQFDSPPGLPEPSETVDVIGHDETASRLTEAHRNAKLHHALMLTGPAGIGKATLAFCLARHLLAHPEPASAPAAFAPSDPDTPLHRQIAAGVHPSVLHLSRPYDEKAKRFRTAITVDEIRRINRFLATTAHDGSWRIVIVDPADDLNRNAANALLKSLEEPPRKTVFILIAHAPGRLLATIRSRCQVHRLHPLGRDDLASVLERIGAELPPHGPARERLYDMADGSVRTAVELTQFGGLEIYAAMENVVDTVDFDVAEAGKVVTAVAARDAAIAFRLFNGHALDLAGRRASVAAASRDSGAAMRLSELHRTIDQAVRDTTIYNLDKRQHAMALLAKLHAAFRGAA